MTYPVVIHKEKGSDYGVSVPDLPGCVSAGRTMDEALAMAQEAIELHLEGMVEEGLAIPKPGRIEAYRSLREFAGGTWAVVSVAGSRVKTRAKRINITIPERVLSRIDRYAKRTQETRSGLLARAAVIYVDGKTGKPYRAGRKSLAARGRRTAARGGK